MKSTFFELNARISKMLFLSLVLAFFSACNPSADEKSKGELSIKKTNVSDNKNLVIEEDDSDMLPFGRPIAFASTNNIAVPIILLVKSQEKDESDTCYMNIAVMNDGNSQARMVFDQPQIIKSITTFEKRVEKGQYEFDEDEEKSVAITPKTISSLLFIDQVSCAECDGALQKLFVYNLKYNVLKQLSPDSLSVSSWFMLKENGKVVMKCIADNNKDGEFSEDEEEVVFVSDFNKPNSKPIRMGFDVAKLKKQRTRLLKEYYQPQKSNKNED